MPQDKLSGVTASPQTKEHRKFDIFLSYARADRDLLTRLIPMLEGASRRVFRDTEQLKGGDQFPDRLHSALQSSEIIVCCWTPAFFQSTWCLHEARYAAKRGKLLPLVLASLGSVDLPPDLENANYFDLTSWGGEFHEEEWQSVNSDLIQRLKSPLDGLDLSERALIRTIYNLPLRHHSAIEANYDRLGGSTLDMQTAVIDIADTLGRYWQQLKKIEAGYSSTKNWNTEYEHFKSRVIENLPPYDPTGGSIQKTNNAESVRNAVAGLVIDQVKTMWPDNDVIDFNTWASHFMQGNPLPPLAEGF